MYFYIDNWNSLHSNGSLVGSMWCDTIIALDTIDTQQLSDWTDLTDRMV